MAPKLRPWQLQSVILAGQSVILAGMLNKHQQRSIEYLKAENHIFREKIGTRQIRLTKYQSRRLAVLAKAVGLKKLSDICSIVTSDTILRLHRKLIAMKYDGSSLRGIGRPRNMP